MPQRIETQEAIIADNGTLSNAVGLGDADVLGLDIPGSMVSGTFKFLASLTFAGTYRYVKAKDLTDLTISATTGNLWVSADVLSPLRGCPFVKIESGASQTGGPHTLTFVLKRFGFR